MPPALGGPQGYTAPEGSWGWMVVMGAFISISFSYAFLMSITVFLKEIKVIFNATPGSLYTYITCGIILMIASISLFVGMGFDYRLLEHATEEEERRK